MEVALIPDVLPLRLFLALQETVAAVFESERSSDDLPGSLCCTHWVHLDGKQQRVAHPIETAVAQLRELPDLQALLATTPSKSTEAVVGVEWWLQEQADDDEPKELHTDKDVAFGSDGRSSTSYPLVSSVFYLCDVGGPTAVFHQRPSSEHLGTMEPPLPLKVCLAFPQVNQLLLFRGDLLHAVLHPPAWRKPSDAAPRRTLLINWWAHRPAAARDWQPELPLCRSGSEDSHGDGLHAGRRRRGSPDAQVPRCPPVAITAGSFLDDAAYWGRQRMPPHVEAVLPTQDPLPLVIVDYSGAREAPASVASGWSWFDEF
eukprot:CAMPEP_0179012402 /NCGR_PEP_ID=MMETSP0796-20121207/1181_1 /TAXON_ID=73915 /ORGANISM="Pyrodinium bahamense, Strain pbaha01" /LENGTH=315 /DNA_ID=CAMNT_0020707851 /DNA_START=21 /DNA_END=968 /DNA_ORIENTATION=+